MCFLIISYLLWNSFAYSQDYNIDSLTNARVNQTPKEVEYWLTTSQMANYYVYHDLKKAQLLIDSVLTNFKRPSISNSIPECFHRHYLIKAWTHHGNNQLEDAIYYMRKADSIATKCYNRKDEIEISINLSSLLVAHQDTSALSYINQILTKVDTSLNRDEKIAWILGKKYTGDIYDRKCFYRLAYNEYYDVLSSGILDEIPNFRIGIIKGLCRVATTVGDYSFANQTMKELASDTTLFTYQNNDIKLGLALQYYKMDSLELAEAQIQKILGSENLNTDIIFESHLLLAKIQTKRPEIESRLNSYPLLDSLIEIIQNPEYEIAFQLVKAQYYCENKQKNKCNNLLTQLLGHKKLLVPQRIRCQEIWLQNNLDGPSKNTFREYHSGLKSYNEKRSNSQLQELIIEHGVEKERMKNARLGSEISNLDKVNVQKSRVIKLLGFSGFLSVLLLFLAKKQAKVVKSYNLLLEKEKSRLEDTNELLESEKKELAEINSNLEEKIAGIKLQSDHKEKLEIKSLDKKHLVNIKDIIYCKAEDEGVRIYLINDRTIWTDLRFKTLFDQLPKTSFLQVFRSTVINVYHLDWVNHATLKMVNGTELKIGRTYKKELRELLG